LANNNIDPSEQRDFKTRPRLKIKHLCDKDYTFEVYNVDELILSTDVNFEVGCKKATYTGL
jgi:hypothetical protein